MNTHILSETLSFLDINKYQDFCGQVALLNSCEHREQILTHWLLNTDYQKRTEKELGETWTLRTRNGLPHSNNFPTEESDSCKIWKKLGVPHRERDLPAYESEEIQKWYWRGKPHRQGDLPALVSRYTKSWFWHGVLHRLHGPAVVYSCSGRCEWWFNGVEQNGGLSLSQIAFNK